MALLDSTRSMRLAEKHVPVVTVDGVVTVVAVGEVEHPMADDHYITFIVLETEKGYQTAPARPGPEARKPPSRLPKATSRSQPTSATSTVCGRPKSSAAHTKVWSAVLRAAQQCGDGGCRAFCVTTTSGPPVTPDKGMPLGIVDSATATCNIQPPRRRRDRRRRLGPRLRDRRCLRRPTGRRARSGARAGPVDPRHRRRPLQHRQRLHPGAGIPQRRLRGPGLTPAPEEVLRLFAQHRYRHAR